MYQEDYIIRIIQGVGVALRAMMSAMREHRPDEALETSREALRLLTGLPPALAEALTADSLLAMLEGPGGIDTKRTLATAELLIRRAEAFEARHELDRAAGERRKALRLLVAVRDAGYEDDARAAETLMAEFEEPR